MTNTNILETKDLEARFQTMDGDTRAVNGNIVDLLRPYAAKNRAHVPTRKIINLGARKYVLAGILLLLGALTIPLLMVVKVVEPSFVLGFVGFGLALTGGILFLIQIGEIY